MPGGSKERKRVAAVAALIAHPTVEAAAEACGVGRATLWRWLNEPEFSAAVEQARQDAVTEAVASLASGYRDAITTLREIALDETAPAASRVTAARSLADLYSARIELDRLLTRLETVEKRL